MRLSHGDLPQERAQARLEVELGGRVGMHVTGLGLAPAGAYTAQIAPASLAAHTASEALADPGGHRPPAPVIASGMGLGQLGAQACLAFYNAIARPGMTGGRRTGSMRQVAGIPLREGSEVLMYGHNRDAIAPPPARRGCRACQRRRSTCNGSVASSCWRACCSRQGARAPVSARRHACPIPSHPIPSHA